LTSIIEKRLCLHKQLANQQQSTGRLTAENDSLRLQIGRLQALANIGITTCMIAHEINNLLTPVANYAAVALKNPGENGLVEKALQKAVRNCRHASKIMESMLAAANSEAQEKENVRLITLIDEVFSCLGRDFAKDGITVKIQIPEDVTVRAVPVQIQQVLMNLILNARNAMLPRGGILAIKAEECPDTIQMEVCDTGCGIEPADLENIFEPFFTTNTDEKSSPRVCGSGLGLAFCKEVIDSHKGRISVESEPARGSTFKIILPKLQ
jgi:signal transduction histidine kinase